MHQVPHRVVGVRSRSVTSGQAQSGEVQLHTNGDQLVQRIALVGGIGDHDLGRQRIITGQGGDTERLVTEEERGNDVLASRQAAASRRSLINELMGIGSGAGADKRVGLVDHAATVDGTHLALVERGTLVAVVGGVQPVAIAHQVAGNAGVGRQDVATVDHRSAVALQTGHRIEDSRSRHRGIRGSSRAVQIREALCGQRGGVTVHLDTRGVRVRIDVYRVLVGNRGFDTSTNRGTADRKVGTDQGVTNHRVHPEGHVQTAGLGGLLHEHEVRQCPKGSQQ